METTQLFNNQNFAGLTTINDTCTGLSYAVKNEQNDTQVEELAMFFVTNQYFGCIKYKQDYYSVDAFREKTSTSGFLYIQIGPKQEMLKMMNQFMFHEVVNQYNPGSEILDWPAVITDYAILNRQINESIQTTNLVKVINLL